ncbi:hypothetical protein [Salinivibrio phage CW02]|uniref:Uncharacterized protein n=1 Tax=Salinivibrio phage CW02 TaxID=1161935 RepID=H9D1F6_9CAUD|nr:hypothetical protein F490_gp39 [Salinivibrio phage CW02]AFE86198.1 hypothetical protein [Salinivibrio phage CW02]
MMMTDVEGLAKSNLNMCCGTLCQPSHIKKYVAHLEEQNEMLRETLGECLFHLAYHGIEIKLDS